jgi:hypothetical protein
LLFYSIYKILVQIKNEIKDDIFSDYVTPNYVFFLINICEHLKQDYIKIEQKNLYIFSNTKTFLNNAVAHEYDRTVHKLQETYMIWERNRILNEEIGADEHGKPIERLALKGSYDVDLRRRSRRKSKRPKRYTPYDKIKLERRKRRGGEDEDDNVSCTVM